MQLLRAGGQGIALRPRALPCTLMRWLQTLPSSPLVEGPGNVSGTSLHFWRQLLLFQCSSGKSPCVLVACSKQAHQPNQWSVHGWCKSNGKAFSWHLAAVSGVLDTEAHPTGGNRCADRCLMWLNQVLGLTVLLLRPSMHANLSRVVQAV